MTDTLTVEGLDEIETDMNAFGPGYPAGNATIRLLIAAARAHLKGGWRPIETAPKDGTPVLLGWNYGHVPFSNALHGIYCDVSWWLEGEGAWEGVLQPPTHWQPLPSPPTITGEEDGVSANMAGASGPEAASETKTEAEVAPQSPPSEVEMTPIRELLRHFSNAVVQKLRKAEEKYGWNNGWLKDNWADDLRRDIRKHVEKGDPRDVAAYCAFAWHHGWSLAPAPSAREREKDDGVSQGEPDDGGSVLVGGAAAASVLCGPHSVSELAPVTPDIPSLVGRLRRWNNPDCHEAADALESVQPLVERLDRYAKSFRYGGPTKEILETAADALEAMEGDVERLKAQVDRFADGLIYEQEQNTKARARIAELEGALEKGATYLEELHDNMLRNDVDMLIDKNESPRAVADRCRAALGKGGSA